MELAWKQIATKAVRKLRRAAAQLRTAPLLE